MKIIWLITAGSFWLSVAISENDVPITNNVQRVPRALVLQPVIKVNSKDEDEGPFDFISDFLLRIINPPKKILPQTQQQSPMLGPIRVPGINDEVYVKQFDTMPRHNSHVIIKVPSADSNKMPMSMPLGMNEYNYQKANYLMGPTRQVPMQSGGFHPVSSPTSNPSWSPSATLQSHMPAYADNIYESPNSIRNGYKNYPNHYRNFRNAPGYPNDIMKNQGNQQNYYNGYQNQGQPQQYYPQYQSSRQSFYAPYDNRYRPQMDYRPYDYYNSIPGNSGRYSNYGLDSPRSTNYSRYPAIRHQEDTDDTTVNEENEAEKDEDINPDNLSGNDEEIINETKSKDIDLPRANPTSARASTKPSELIEIYRSDRMVPTNPTYRNRFWTRTTSRTPAKVSSTTEHYNVDQAEESLKKERKYSSRGIEEIPAPDLKAWNDSIKHENNAEQSSDSRMDDEDGIIMKDGTTLGKGESHEYVDEVSTTQLRSTEPLKNISSLSTSRNSRNWKPIEQSKRKEDHFVKGNLTRVENATPDVLNKVMSLTASNSRQHNNVTKSSKIKFPRLKNSKNRRVRVVESVKSSVSMTSSRGVKKPKIKN